MSTFNDEDVVNIPYGGLKLLCVPIMAGISWKRQCDCMLTLI